MGEKIYLPSHGYLYNEDGTLLGKIDLEHAFDETAPSRDFYRTMSRRWRNIKKTINLTMPRFRKNGAERPGQAGTRWQTEDANRLVSPCG